MTWQLVRYSWHLCRSRLCHWEGEGRAVEYLAGTRNPLIQCASDARSVVVFLQLRLAGNHWRRLLHLWVSLVAFAEFAAMLDKGTTVDLDSCPLVGNRHFAYLSALCRSGDEKGRLTMSERFSRTSLVFFWFFHLLQVKIIFCRGVERYLRYFRWEMRFWTRRRSTALEILDQSSFGLAEVRGALLLGWAVMRPSSVGDI